MWYKINYDMWYNINIKTILLIPSKTYIMIVYFNFPIHDYIFHDMGYNTWLIGQCLLFYLLKYLDLYIIDFSIIYIN